MHSYIGKDYKVDDSKTVKVNKKTELITIRMKLFMKVYKK